MTQESLKKGKVLSERIEGVEGYLRDCEDVKRLIDNNLFKFTYHPFVWIRVTGAAEGLGDIDVEFQVPKKVKKQIIDIARDAIEEYLNSIKKEFAEL